MATTRGTVLKHSSPVSPLTLTPADGARPPKGKVVCPICLEAIVDGNVKRKGHDSILCEGRCQEWVHRQCAGLSQAAFNTASMSSTPFKCPRCLLACQSDDISSLKDEIKALASEVDSLRSQFKSTCQDEVKALASVVEGLRSQFELNHEMPDGVNSRPTTPTEGEDDKVTHSNRGRHHHRFSSQSGPGPVRESTGSSSPRVDRRFNIIVFGIEEFPSGTFRTTRLKGDFDKVSDIILTLEQGTGHSSSVRDCRRIGKYDGNSSKSRPILVQLNSTVDVAHILSLKKSQGSSISFRADLPPEVRKAEAVLLAERWKLIQSGTVRSAIKIRKSSIFVNNSLYGSVSGSVFSLSDLSHDLAPAVSTLVDPSTADIPSSGDTSVTTASVASVAHNQKSD